MKNVRGFSLVNVVISMGLMSGLALSQMHMSANQAKATRSNKANHNREELKEVFRTILSDAAVCLENFGGRSANTPYLFPANIPLTVNGAPKLVRNLPLGEGTLKVNAFSFGNTSPLMIGTTQAISIFTVLFDRTGDQYGGESIKVEIPIHAYIDATNNVVTCTAVSDQASGGGGASPWSYTPTDTTSIFSDVIGNVGIGTNDPQFKFHVVGNAYVDTLTTGHSTNIIDPAQTLSTIIGGSNNQITDSGMQHFIIGGSDNIIAYGSSPSANWARSGIIGGYANVNKASEGYMLGGKNNYINQIHSGASDDDGLQSIIIGGNSNLNDGQESIILGGTNNKIKGGVRNSILYGDSNIIKKSTTQTSMRNMIMGDSNIIDPYSPHNKIIGSYNYIPSGNDFCTIIGNYNNCQTTAGNEETFMFGSHLASAQNNSNPLTIVGTYNDVTDLQADDTFVVGAGDWYNKVNAIKIKKGGAAYFHNNVYAQTMSTPQILLTSDRRHKKNFNYSESHLDNILNLIPASYEYKNKPGEKRNGFIAQEINEVYPHLVDKSDDSKWRVNMTDLIAPIVSAFQESHTDNQERLAVLERENKELKELVCLDHPTARFCY